MIIDSEDLTQPIPSNTGIGSVVESDGEIYTAKGPRELYLDITDMFGSFGAIHYYGKLYSPTLYFSRENGTSFTTNMCPKEADRIEIRVTRKLTCIEFDANREPLGRTGEWTDRFKTKEEIKIRAKQIVRKYFPDWEVIHWHRAVNVDEKCKWCIKSFHLGGGK